MSARQISQTVNGLVIIFAVTLAHGAQPSCVPVHGMSLQDLQSFDFQARGEKYKAQTA